MRPQFSWVPAFVPGVLFAASLVSLANPVPAHAAGINLAWDECGAAGTEIKTFACDSNTGEPFSLVASFVPPPGIAEYLGLSAEFRIAGPVLPDWWKHGNGSCRGSTALSTSFDPPGNACVDYWQGRGVGGFLYEVEHSGPNTALLRVQAALPFEARGPLDPGSEYYAFTVRLQRSKSASPSECPGCESPVAIALEHIQLFQPPEAKNDPILKAPIYRNVAFWQNRVVLPTITSVSPLAGGTGTPVRIEGTGLGSATSVLFGGVESTFQIESDFAVDAIVPAGARSGPIAVLTPNGTATSAASFTASPVITGFVPTSGEPGTRVTISGLNLASVTAVEFNGAAAVVEIVSDASIRVTVPSGATSGPITALNPAGSTSTSTPFVVVANSAPIVTSFAPLAGPTGSTVVLTGSGFTQVRYVRFGGVTAQATVVSDTRIDATVPSLARSGPIAVVTALGTTISSASFTAPPVISDITAVSRVPGGDVHIHGFNFTGATAVHIGGAAADFNVITDNRVVAQIPATAVTGPVEVENAAANTVSTNVLHIGFPPSLVSFAPQSGATGTTVVIEGSELTEVQAVLFGGVPSTFTVVSTSRIEAVVPPLARSGPIQVRTVFGSATTSTTFTAFPVIEGFAPLTAGPGSQVQIHGFNFTGTTAVRIGGVAANFGVISDILVLAQVPATAVTGPIEVENAAGSTASTSVLRIGTAPTLVSFAPQLGAPGTTVVIEGSGFTEVEAVLFGGVSSTFTVVSVSRIEATVPPLARSGPIQVRTVFGSATTTAPFMAPSVVTRFEPSLVSIGAEVHVYGFNFGSATGVRVGGAVAAFSILADDVLSVQVPDAAITGPIEVENPAGVGTSASTLTIGPRPILTSFDPQAGAVGSTVTLEGSGFTEVHSVRFGGAGAAFTALSELRIETVVPPDVRSGPIVVTTAFGTATSVESFTAPPVVTGFDRAHAPVGAEIEIRGYNFTGATEVRFNSLPAAFAVISAAAIRATVPVGATSGPVSVVNAAGTGTSSQAFLVGEFTDGGINLAWDDCGTAGTSVKAFACNTNTGAPFSVVASFSPPPGIDLFLGLSATVLITGEEMPDWWKHGASSCRGTTGIGTNFDFASGPFSCADFYAGRAAGGFAYDVGYEAPNRSRLRIQCAVPFENRGPVNMDLEYYAFKVNLLRSKSTGTGACSGCATPMQITLDEIQLFQPPEARNDPVLTTPIHSAVAFWQAVPGPVLPEIFLFEPTRDLPGRPVSIAGRHFVGTTSVRFGAVEAAFEVESDEHILATVPVGAVDGPITIVSPGGTATSVEIFQVGAPTIAEGPNLVVDPSFERSVPSWRPVYASVDRSAYARSGDYAMSVRGEATVHRFDLNDRPNHVASTPRAGSTYRYKAWIKVPVGDVTARLRVKEYQGVTSIQTATSPEMSLTTLWQRLVCEVTSLEAGTSLDFQFIFDPSVPEAEVLVDDVSIREQGVGPVVTAPELIEATVGTPIEIVVTAAANGGPPLVALDAGLAGLPMLSNATFTPDPDFSRGVLRWTPQPEDGAWVYAVTFKARSEVDGIATTRIHVAAAPPDPRRMWIDFDIASVSRWREHRGGTRQWTSPGRSFSPGALVVHSPDPATTFGINDYPNWVAYTGTNPGERFRFTCWMRAVTGAGKGMLRVNEYVDNVKVGSSTLSGELLLTDEWQQVVVERVTEAAGSSLDIRIECDPTSSATSFMVDDLSIRYPASIPAAERFAAAGSYVIERPTMFPNPIRDRATLSWSQAAPGLLKVGIFDVNGRRMRSVIHDPEAQPGAHFVMIDRRDERGEQLAAGVYFYRIESADGVRQGRFVILE